MKLIDQTVQQAVRAVAPLEEAIACDIERAALVHADECGWRKAGIESCRLRAANVIDLLAQAIDAARRGLPVPPVPAISR